MYKKVFALLFYTWSNTPMHLAYIETKGNKMQNVNITKQSKSLFIEYWKDAANWSGTPAIGHNVESSKENNGNLTQLKVAGLITTWNDDGSTWLRFTNAGKEYGKSIGLNVESLGE